MKSTLNGPSQGVEGPEIPRPINHRQIPPGVGAQSATIAILHGDYWVSGTVGNLGSGFPMSCPSCEIEQGQVVDETDLQSRKIFAPILSFLHSHKCPVRMDYLFTDRQV